LRTAVSDLLVAAILAQQAVALSYEEKSLLTLAEEAALALRMSFQSHG